MATALAAGAISAGEFETSEVVFAEPNLAQQSKLREKFSDANIVSEASQLFAETKKIVLAVKPHILRGVASDLKALATPEHLLVSIAGGIGLSSLQEMLGTKRVVRVMPNTPCQVLQGASAIALDSTLSAEDKQWTARLMSSVGEVEQIPDELIHAFTGIAGSSPAYIYLIIEALSDGGVSQGLPRAFATKMAAQAVLGAAKMVLESGLHPGELKDQVTSPGGTTIEAIRALEQAGVRSGVIEAVVRCTQRSKEMA